MQKRDDPVPDDLCPVRPARHHRGATEILSGPVLINEVELRIPVLQPGALGLFQLLALILIKLRCQTLVGAVELCI